MPAPLSDEIEVTVFGADSGECCVIHVGRSEWIIVDSCIERKSKKPVALEYLGGIGVDVGTQVSLVVATHWHSDHIRGLSEVYRQCQNANFCLPLALNQTVAKELFARTLTSPVKTSLATVELAEISRLFSDRKRRDPDILRTFAVSDRTISRNPQDQNSDVKIVALSPDDGEFVHSATSFTWSPDNQHLTYVAMSESNDISSALWIGFVKEAVLLGADLTDTTASGEGGWQMVLRKFADRLTRSEIFKIPHHGSSNAHCPEVWNKMLTPKPLSVVTAFNRGTNPPPEKSDLIRDLKLSSKLYFTGRSQPKNGLPAGFISPGVRSSVAGHYAQGKVTFRKRIGDGPSAWSVSTDGRASMISATIIK